jgi:hypothetical protein
LRLHPKIRITGQKKDDNLFYSINGTGVFKGIYPGDKPVKVEWKQVNKVVLRYNEIH